MVEHIGDLKAYLHGDTLPWTRPHLLIVPTLYEAGIQTQESLGAKLNHHNVTCKKKNEAFKRDIKSFKKNYLGIPTLKQCKFFSGRENAIKKTVYELLSVVYWYTSQSQMPCVSILVPSVTKLKWHNQVCIYPYERVGHLEISLAQDNFLKFHIHQFGLP